MLLSLFTGQFRQFLWSAILVKKKVCFLVCSILVYLAVNQSHALFYSVGHQLLGLLKIHQREAVRCSQKRTVGNNMWIGKGSIHIKQAACDIMQNLKYMYDEPVFVQKTTSTHAIIIINKPSVAGSRKIQPSHNSYTPKWHVGDSSKKQDLSLKKEALWETRHFFNRAVWQSFTVCLQPKISP